MDITGCLCTFSNFHSDSSVFVCSPLHSLFICLNGRFIGMRKFKIALSYCSWQHADPSSHCCLLSPLNVWKIELVNRICDENKANTHKKWTRNVYWEVKRSATALFFSFPSAMPWTSAAFDFHEIKVLS